MEQRWRIKLTDKGLKYLERFESEREIERKINELLEDIRDYLNKKFQLSLDSNEIYKILLLFINENISSVIEFFNPGERITTIGIPTKKNRKYGKELVSYFEIAEKQKPVFYKTLQDIVYGSMISTLASNKNIAEANKKFKHTQVFLDSNFLLSLLELHFPELNKPVIELFNLLRLYKFKLKVFDFTIDEIVNVLRNYLNEQHLYVPDIQVNSIYSNLKSLGWTVEDVREFIQKIEEQILSLDILIEPTNINIKNYKPKKEEYLSKILEYKPFQNSRARNHDLVVIEKIKEIRSSPKREIEKSKAFFLTSDLKLAKFNFIVMEHKQRATICEVIPDRLLTNILWLKNPIIKKDIPLTSIIAIHSREVFIDREIWKRFYENLKKLKKEKNINDKDLSMIFYNHHIEQVLSGFDASEIDKITPDLILEEIQKTSRTIDLDKQKEIEEQKIFFEEKIVEKELQKEREKENELIKIKKNLNKSCRKKVNNYINIISWIVIGLMGVVLLQMLDKISGILIIAASVCTILAFLGIKLDFKGVRYKLEIHFFNKVYLKKLKELGLN